MAFTPQYGFSSGGIGYEFNTPQGWGMSSGGQSYQSAGSFQQPQVLGATAPTAPTNPAPVEQNQPQQQQVNPQDEINSQLEGIFSPVFNALQGQESTLRENYATVPGEINAQYTTSGESIAREKQSGLTEAGTQEKQAGTRKTDALTAATRLYSELSRGGQQRFGGASSAGEAYGALTAVEQQRRQGTIQTAYEGAMTQIGTFKQNIIDKSLLAVKELENQKNAALNQAQRDFRDALQQIQSMRAQAQSEKATASMNALNDLRNKVYTINAQSLQFAQTLATNQQMSLKAVDDYTAKVAQSLSGGQVAVTNFANQATTNPQTSYGISAGQQTAQTPMVGQTTSLAGKRWDETTGTFI